jgi:hypothetical protein
MATTIAREFILQVGKPLLKMFILSKPYPRTRFEFYCESVTRQFQQRRSSLQDESLAMVMTTIETCRNMD